MARRRFRGRVTLSVLMLGWLGLGVAQAVDATVATRTTAIEAVLACRGVEPADRQLTCFRAASDLLAAERTSMRPPPAPMTPEIPFGARPAPLTRAAKPHEVRQVTLRLTSINDPGDGRMVFGFADGSIWREIEAEPTGGSLKPGQQITLEKGALGSYFLDIKGRASIRVARERGS